MKILKKIIGEILIISIFMNLIFINVASSKSLINKNKRINASVLFYKYNEYTNQLKSSFERIQENNKDTINYKFYDGEGKQSVQNNQLDEIIKEGTDIILLSLVDINSDKAIESVINKIKMNNIPIIFFHRQPQSLKSIASYGKSLFIGPDDAESGRLQGTIINEAWRHKEIFDENNNGIFEYILIKGDRGNVTTETRSEYVIRSLNEYGIKSLEIASEYCNWDKDYAKSAVKNLFLSYGNSIEGIICNNDEMAEGSIEAIREFGYNVGNLDNNNIIVVGIDGLEEALNLIKKKEMTGTVIHDINGMAEALYLVGNNMVLGKNPLSNTKYKFDSSGVALRIPYLGYEIIKF